MLVVCALLGTAGCAAPSPMPTAAESSRSFVKLVKGTGLFSVGERDGKFCKFREKVG